MMDEVGDHDAAALRRAYACFPSGVTALCGLVGGLPDGMAASSFTSVSLDPPIVSLCVAHTSTTWPRLAALPTLGVSVLAEGHTELARSLSAKQGDRFAAARWTSTASGAVLLHGSTLWLECAVDSVVAAGDHDIVLLAVRSLCTFPDVEPMVFHGSAFRQLVPAST